MVHFIELENEFGKMMWINPNSITAIVECGDEKCGVDFNRSSVMVKVKAKDLVERIRLDLLLEQEKK